MSKETERLKQLNDKYDRIYNEKYSGQNTHDKPPSETRERLIILETTQQFMVKEISEIKDLVKGLDAKLENIMTCKADKEEVESVKTDVKELNKFMWKVLGVSSLGIVVLGTLATLLVNHLVK